MTKKQLADAAGVSWQTISAIERHANHVPHFLTMRRIVDVLNVTAADVTEFATDVDAIPVVIYGLIDPRDRIIRYVGQTYQDTESRLTQHVHNSKSPLLRSYLYHWIRELLDTDVFPQIVTLEVTTKESADAHEQSWIKRLHDETGKLVNTTACQPGATYERQRRKWDEQKQRTSARRRRGRDGATAHRIARRNTTGQDRVSAGELKAFRDIHGLSQTDLAEALGYDNSTVSLWESGKRIPPPGLRILLDRIRQKEAED